jgi:hypothetical protein
MWAILAKTAAHRTIGEVFTLFSIHFRGSLGCLPLEWSTTGTLMPAAVTTSSKTWEEATLATYVLPALFCACSFVSLFAFLPVQSEKYVVHENSLSSLVFESHASFMMAEPPGDLHRRNVLRNGVTHVGIGLYYSDKHFRLVEVFAARYIELLDKSPDGADAAPGFRLTTDETYIYAKVRVFGRVLAFSP